MAEFVAARSGETEAEFRQFLTNLFNQLTAGGTARDGVLTPGHGLFVQQTTTASGSVTVQAGAGVVQDTTLQGVYPLLSHGVTLDVLGPNPMGGVPRNDIVVFDSATASIRNIVGTPSAVPTDPTVPGTAIPLARLRHSASATTVTTASIDDLRQFTTLRGGILNARTSAEMPTAHAGSAAYRWDREALHIATSGGSWKAFPNVSDGKAGKRTHWGTATVSTDSSGYATVTHGAGFTPEAVMLTGTTITWRIMADNFTSTTFRVKTFNGSGTGVPLVGVKFSYFCGE